MQNENWEAKWNILSKSDQFLFLMKQKNVFHLVLLQSKNNKVEAKRKFWSEKKRKNRPESFEVNKRNTCETDPISLYFACKRKIFWSETGAP